MMRDWEKLGYTVSTLFRAVLGGNAKNKKHSRHRRHF